MLISGTTPVPVRAARDEVVLRPGDGVPSPDGMRGDFRNSPAARFVRVYLNDVFALQGSTAVSYGSRTPDEVKLRFLSYDHALLADGVLKDTVLGAKLVYTDRDGQAFDMTRPGSDWIDYPTNYARNVAAMPDVVNFRWNGNTIIFGTTSTEARVRLQQLVDRKLNGETMAYWKGECFGPGCKPDPAPPTGEV